MLRRHFSLFKLCPILKRCFNYAFIGNKRKFPLKSTFPRLILCIRHIKHVTICSINSAKNISPKTRQKPHERTDKVKKKLMKRNILGVLFFSSSSSQRVNVKRKHFRNVVVFSNFFVVISFTCNSDNDDATYKDSVQVYYACSNCTRF